MKNALDGVKRRLSVVNKGISELEETSIEVSQFEKQMKNNEKTHKIVFKDHGSITIYIT